MPSPHSSSQKRTTARRMPSNRSRSMSPKGAPSPCWAAATAAKAHSCACFPVCCIPAVARAASCSWIPSSSPKRSTGSAGSAAVGQDVPDDDGAGEPALFRPCRRHADGRPADAQYGADEGFGHLGSARRTRADVFHEHAPALVAGPCAPSAPARLAARRAGRRLGPGRHDRGLCAAARPAAGRGGHALCLYASASCRPAPVRALCAAAQRPPDGNGQPFRAVPGGRMRRPRAVPSCTGGFFARLAG